MMAVFLRAKPSLSRFFCAEAAIDPKSSYLRNRAAAKTRELLLCLIGYMRLTHVANSTNNMFKNNQIIERKAPYSDPYPKADLGNIRRPHSALPLYKRFFRRLYRGIFSISVHALVRWGSVAFFLAMMVAIIIDSCTHRP